MSVSIDLDCVLLVRRIAGDDGPPPTLLHVFLHSSWSGAWVAGRVLPDGSAAFRVRAPLRPLRKSTLERAVLPSRDDEFVRCCDGGLHAGSVLKAHFYRPLDGARQAPEFAFASAVPAERLARPFELTHLGVWNSFLADCVQSAQPHPDWIVHALCVRPTRLPPGVSGPAADAPRPGRPHYERVMDVSEWICASLEAAYPRHKGENFLFPATCMRDGYSMALLQDLPKLLGRRGSCLPPALCCYAMMHALAEHALTPADFRALVVQALAARASSPRLLRAVQSVAVCFSACAVEGHYRSDTVNGKVADDQPYMFSERPPADVLAEAAAAGERVHVASALQGDLDDVADPDDCEGSTQRACIFLSEALRCMAADRADGAFAHTLRHFAKEGKGAGLDVSPESLRALMDCCADIGDLLRGGRLRVSVVDGAVRMGVLVGVEGEPPAGHCFGLLCMRSDDSDVEEGLIVETTMWTMSHPAGLSAAAAAVMQLVEKHEDHVTLVARRVFTASVQEAMYPYITVGDGHVFFTLRSGHARPDVTTSTRAVQEHGIMWARREDAGAEARVAAALEASGGTLALAVSTEDLLAAMDPAEPAWLGLPKSRVRGAAAARGKYAEALKTYPHMASLLRPPPEPEANILDKIRRMYGVLTDADLPKASLPAPPAVAFTQMRSRPRRGAALAAALAKIPGVVLRQHAFARSVVTTVHVVAHHE